MVGSKMERGSDFDSDLCLQTNLRSSDLTPRRKQANLISPGFMVVCLDSVSWDNGHSVYDCCSGGLDFTVFYFFFIYGHFRVKGFDGFVVVVDVVQVGSYFVTYYQLLQQRPEYVHYLYSDSSIMLWIDGHNREAATAMVDTTMREMHDARVTIDDIAEVLKRTPIHPRIIEAIKSAYAAGVLFVVDSLAVRFKARMMS
ncbi:hypothetical protein Droror1_Dr00004821 [Drosera rotundifolia]